MDKTGSKEFIWEAVRQFIYETDPPNWFGLQQELLSYGYAYGEVYEILREVREGGY